MAETILGDNIALLLVLAGSALVILEAFAPGAHFVVVGVALLVAGLVGMALPPGLGVLTPLVLSALVLIVGGLTLYVYRQFDFYGGKGTARTSDSSSLRGKTGHVTERVSDSTGEVKLDEGGFNPVYQARSTHGELEVGTEVIVVEPGGGNVVTVESIEDDEIDRELAKGGDADDREPDSDVEAA